MDTVDGTSFKCCPAGVLWQGQEAPMGREGAGQVHVALLHRHAALHQAAQLCCMHAAATVSLGAFLSLLISGCPQLLPDPDQCL